MNDATEILIERALHLELDAKGWAELAAAAERDPTLYKCFFDYSRDQSELRALTGGLSQSATSISLPTPRNYRPFIRAAAILIMVGTAFLSGRTLDQQQSEVIEPAVMTADEHLTGYLERGKEEGRVLFELAPRILEAKHSDTSDDLEVVIVRQIVERSSTPGFLAIERDEYGRAHGRLVAAHEIPSPRSF